MLFKFTTEQIEHFKNTYVDAESCLIALVGEEKYSKLKFPSIKYAPSMDQGWKEFHLCFHESREKVYANMLRPKYLNGQTWRRVMGGK